MFFKCFIQDFSEPNNNLGYLGNYYKCNYVLRSGTLLDFILNEAPNGGIIGISPFDNTITDTPIQSAWSVAIVYKHASAIWTVKWFQDSIPDKEYVNQIYVDHWVNAAWKHIDYVI